MSAFGAVVVGKRETLCRAGVVRQGESPLDWPDQGTAERNWALNSALLEQVIAAGAPIRDADVEWGVLRGHTGFLARERAQLRGAGLRLGAGGYWRMPARRSLVELAPVLLARARAAAAAGARTFSLPEAAPVAAWIAARVADPELRGRAIAWLRRGTPYHELVRLCARAARALDAPPFDAAFRRKVGDELEPMLALWPHHLVVPTPAPCSRADLIRLRAFPLHPLGLVAEATWADGGLLAPSEHLFHDLDHARFKVREDLLLRGVAIPDAYRDGSTFDPRTGRHRAILAFAAARLGEASRGGTAGVRAGARHLLARIDGLPSSATARAARALLFELVHDKSLPLDPSSLARAAADDGHLAKLERKRASGFFGAGDPGPEVMRALPAAQAALVELCS